MSENKTKQNNFLKQTNKQPNKSHTHIKEKQNKKNTKKKTQTQKATAITQKSFGIVC